MSSLIPSVESLAREVKEFRDDRIFYIACDDRYAPKQYFDFFRISRIKVEVIPAMDNKSHAKWALQKLQEKQVEEGDERWLVLDTDHCIEPSHFRTYELALSEARQQQIKIALSKPSFEVWLAAHRMEMAELEPCKNAGEVCSALARHLGGYDKTQLDGAQFSEASVTEAYWRARQWDELVLGGDNPGRNTTRVYQIWHNILLKSARSQVYGPFRGLLGQISGQRIYQE